jgi:NADPH:quinone reductase-like Zn-dependent oxidoreductase
MKAIICTRYGSTKFLKLTEVMAPTPKENEILVKVQASTVQAADWRIQSLTLPRGMKLICRLIFGFSKPRQPILGTELSGVVTEVGKSVNRFKVGDNIIATTGKFGAHAEFITLAEDGVVFKKPNNLSFQKSAALAFGGTTALHFLRDKGRLQKGDHLLVNGASGPVGVAAIQLAKHFGAKVTAICSEEHFDLVKSLGADKTIDYNKEDFRKNDEKYDVIMDIVGTLRFSTTKNSLRPNGRLLLVTSDLIEMLLIPWNNLTHSQKVIAGVTKEDPNLLNTLLELVQNGQFQSIIDKEFSFEKTPEAFTYVAQRHKKGNVVINMTTLQKPLFL